jgi:hypothetical protein
MNRKNIQLQWYEGDITEQDYDLEQFVHSNGISGIKYIGDSEYLKPILEKEHNSTNLCVYIVNSPFRFDDIIDICNNELKVNKFLYLSINKFLAISESQDNINEDYDEAIYDYIKNHTNYPILKYKSGKEDGGKKFNWVHPLTRFYFYNENII